MVSGVFLLPLILNSGLAFTNWSTFRSTIEFVGLQNFQAMAKLNEFVRPMTLTISYAITVMIALNLAGLGLALLLERANRVNQIYRTLFFIPVAISSLAAGYIWHGLLDPDGPLNALLSIVVPGGPVTTPWLGLPDTAIFTVALIHAWQWAGFSMIVYIGGLTVISREVVEAAVVDGASPWQVFRHVKLRLLAPALTFNIVLTLIGAMNAFDIILATTRGGPGDATTVLNIVTWRRFGDGFFGHATASSLTVMVLVILVSIPLIRFLRSREIAA